MTWEVRITEKVCRVWQVEAATEEDAIQKAWDGDGEDLREDPLNADVLAVSMP